MLSRPSKGLPCLVEVSSFLFVLGVHFLCLRYLQKFDFYGEAGRRWLALAISPLPVLFCYFVLRGFLRPVSTSVIVAGLEFILSVANSMKVTIINEALSWKDLTEFTNYAIIFRYFHLKHYLVVLVLVFAVIFSLWLDRKLGRISWVNRLIYLVLGILLFPAVFCSQLAEGETEAAQILRNYLWKFQIIYFIPDWKKDVKLNGLPYHLAHTSRKKKPAQPNEVQAREFAELLIRKDEKIERPKTIIYILCESCWHDKDNFFELFRPLHWRGFKEIRSISPVYGGLTPNAAFEVLSGLPSRTKSLDGVIYQEYASEIYNKTHVLPSHLTNLGYSTIAIHNHDKYFWHRHIINPKFGFQRFIGIQDMNYQSLNGDWADDSVLYKSALDVLKEKKDKPLFLYLTTVYSHGPYEQGSDLGVTDYRKRLSTAISRLIKFVDEVGSTYPDSLVMIFGDHKPSLNEFFKRNRIIPSQAFESERPWELLGDVPVYIRAPNPHKLDEVVKNAQGLPFFCLSKAIDEQFLNSGVPAFNFSRRHQLCEDYKNKGYSFYKNAYPEWLYSASLFRDSKPTVTQRLHSWLDF